MNQMMMEIERVVRFHLVFVCRTTSTELLVNVGGVVVDDHDHAAGPAWFLYMRTRSGFLLQELTQPRNFLYTEIMGMGLPEKGALVADAEHKFVVSVRLTSPRCSTSSTASLQLRLWGSLPLRRF